MSKNPSPPKIRVAILGCGQIADAHLQELKKVPAAEVVAVCDVHQDLADQAAARFEVPAAFNNWQQMLETARPELIHITTPAHTHALLAKKLLQAGLHVYVEKPFTLNVREADEVFAAATSANRLICVGHDQLFDPLWLEARQRIASGKYGAVRHVESVLAYPLAGNFGKQVTSDPNHWVRKLPGGLFHNTISHPLYRITDLLPDENPTVTACWFSRPPQINFPCELTVFLHGQEVTGNLWFTSAVQPPQRITRIFGTKSSFELDFDTQLIREIRAPGLPGALGKLAAPARHFREAGRNLGRNLWKFVRSRIHYFAGMRNLFAAFIHSIQTGEPPPISYEEIRRVTLLMDQIFDQCQQHSTPSFQNSPQPSHSVSQLPSIDIESSHDRSSDRSHRISRAALGSRSVE